MSEPITSSDRTGSAATSPVEPPEPVRSQDGPVRSQYGPATVINPERRPGGGTPVPGSAESGSGAKSSLVRVLFPPEDDAAARSFDAPRGIELGHFTIVERIRSGGMGAVFRALDTRLNRVVALKVLPPALTRDPSIVQRFKNEAQSAAQLDHENIARVFYVGEEHGLNFIAFEFITGTNIRELIQQQGRLPVGIAVNYALQIASALVHTSAQGVVHRDIKPSNIIITPAGRAKLVDLGLARKENRDDQAVDLTMAGTTLGTFDYISPEQARDPRTADVRSDIYSLGCTLYHMLTGDPPYPEGTVLQKLLQHQGDDAPDPALKNSAVPENLSVVIRKMMAKDPRRRYQNAEQLVRDLMLVAGAMGLRSVSPEGLVWLSSSERRSSFWERHLAWMATGAALLLIVGYLEFGNPGTAERLPVDRPTTGPAAVGSDPNSISSTRPVFVDDSAKPARTSSPKKGPLRGGARQAAGRLSSSDLLADRSVSLGTGGSQSPTADGEHDEPRSFKPFRLNDEKRPTAENSFTLGPPPESIKGGSRKPAGDSAKNGPLVDPRSRTGTDAAADNASQSAKTATTDTPKTNGGTARSNTTERRPNSTEGGVETESPTISTSEDDGIFVLGREGAPDRRFASLELACSGVRNDGAVIELRFDGRRIETGLKITRKVTIRNAPGRRPVIEFRPNQVVTDGYQVRAIAIPSGSLDLIGVELALFVDDTVSAEQWSVFSVERPESLSLQRVTATLLNPRFRPAAIIELRSGADAMMPDMPMVGVQPRPALEVELKDSLFRGQGDLFLVRHADPARLAVRQCVVALQGTLLSARGAAELAQESAQLELRLEHVTAGLADGLIKLDSGPLPRKLLPVHVFAADCIFSSSGSAPLVSMTGNSPLQDFATLLSWNGKNNIYDRYQTYWSVVSMEGTGRSDTWDFATWRKNWTDAGEANARAVDGGIWKGRWWNQKPITDLVAADFALERQMPNNPAVAGATNSSDAGANLTTVPRPTLSAATDERVRE
ncbi:MAG: serine/threonine protein kinase [Planctomycetaceae bacterium]|nr:serine/threonine protein kinase [Planctomycetaceae bacterium]